MAIAYKLRDIVPRDPFLNSSLSSATSNSSWVRLGEAIIKVLNSPTPFVELKVTLNSFVSFGPRETYLGSISKAESWLSSYSIAEY